jgi:hypothetical protein
MPSEFVGQLGQISGSTWLGANRLELLGHIERVKPRQCLLTLVTTADVSLQGPLILGTKLASCK